MLWNESVSVHMCTNFPLQEREREREQKVSGGTERDKEREGETKENGRKEAIQGVKD